MAARAWGFCVYNDPALAVVRARADGLRVLYVDLDVHHGDGVQVLTYGDPGALTLSFHESGRYLFPETGLPGRAGRGGGGRVVGQPAARAVRRGRRVAARGARAAAVARGLLRARRGRVAARRRLARVGPARAPAGDDDGDGRGGPAGRRRGPSLGGRPLARDGRRRLRRVPGGAAGLGADLARRRAPRAAGRDARGVARRAGRREAASFGTPGMPATFLDAPNAGMAAGAPQLVGEDAVARHAGPGAGGGAAAALVRRGGGPGLVAAAARVGGAGGARGDRGARPVADGPPPGASGRRRLPGRRRSACSGPPSSRGSVSRHASCRRSTRRMRWRCSGPRRRTGRASSGPWPGRRSWAWRSRRAASAAATRRVESAARGRRRAAFRGAGLGTALLRALVAGRPAGVAMEARFGVAERDWVEPDGRRDPAPGGTAPPRAARASSSAAPTRTSPATTPARSSRAARRPERPTRPGAPCLQGNAFGFQRARLRPCTDAVRCLVRQHHALWAVPRTSARRLTPQSVELPGQCPHTSRINRTPASLPPWRSTSAILKTRHRDLERSLGLELRRLREDAGPVTGPSSPGLPGINPGITTRIEGGTAHPSTEVLLRLVAVLGADLSIRFFPSDRARASAITFSCRWASSLARDHRGRLAPPTGSRRLPAGARRDRRGPRGARQRRPRSQRSCTARCIESSSRSGGRAKRPTRSRSSRRRPAAVCPRLLVLANTHTMREVVRAASETLGAALSSGPDRGRGRQRSVATDRRTAASITWMP